MPKLHPPGDPRPCNHPQARHEHGTEQAYISDRCRCTPCRDAHASKATARRRQIAYGRHQSALVLNVGSRRRVEALACLGWSMTVLAPMLHCTDRSLHRLFEDGVQYVSRARAESIVRLYDELWDKPAPQTTKGERISARRVLLIARTRRYAPPAAWDDDLIDHPAAQPMTLEDDTLVDTFAIGQVLAGQKVPTLTWMERRALIEQGKAAGMTGDRITDLLRGIHIGKQPPGARRPRGQRHLSLEAGIPAAAFTAALDQIRDAA